MGTRWRVNGRTFDIPEDKLNSFFDSMDKRGFTPTSVDDEESDAELGAAPGGGAPLPPSGVADSMPDLTITESIVVPRAETAAPGMDPETAQPEASPNAPPVEEPQSTWVDGLINFGKDRWEGIKSGGLVGALMGGETFEQAMASDTETNRQGLLDAGKALVEHPRSAAAGYVRGYSANLPNVLARHTDAFDGYREIDREAEAESAPAYAIGDAIGSSLNPINYFTGGLSRFIRPATRLGAVGRAGTDVVSQGITGLADAAARRYGDDPSLSAKDAVAESGVEGAIGALASVPGAAVGGAAARSHTRQTQPEAMKSRAQDYRNARLRSAGINPETDLQGMHPDEIAQMVTDVEGLAAQGGDGWRNAPTVQEMNNRARAATDAAGAEKNAALAALAEQGALVNPDRVASRLESNIVPGPVPDGPLGTANAQYGKLARGYRNMERPVDIAEPPPAPAQPPPLPAAPPPPTPSAAPDLPMQVADEDLTPVRPSARYSPTPEAMPAGPSGPPPGAQATAPDPVGALAAQASDPAAFGGMGMEGGYNPFAGLGVGSQPLPGQLPPPRAQGLPTNASALPDGPSQPPMDNPGAFASMGMEEVPLEGVAAPRGMPISTWDPLHKGVGASVPKDASTLTEKINSNHYAALMDQAREDFGAVDPALASQWDTSNRREGRMLDITRMGHAAANRPETPLVRALGGLGPAAAFGAAAGSQFGYPAAIAGAAAGLAGGRWASPRRYALEAEWLSKDTAAMMNKLSGLGRAPVGALTSSFGDLMRDPPPSAEQDSDPNGPRSALNPGTFLGRDTTRAMEADPEPFLPWADDYAKAATDDDRAAVTERLYRTDVEFAQNVFPRIAREMV